MYMYIHVHVHVHCIASYYVIAMCYMCGNFHSGHTIYILIDKELLYFQPD